MFSELLTELVPGEEDPEDLELLIHVATTSKEMQDRVGELVRMVEHREITVALLEINDRILSEMVRFQRYENKRRNKEAETTKTTTISEAESEVCRIMYVTILLGSVIQSDNLMSSTF